MNLKNLHRLVRRVVELPDHLDDLHRKVSALCRDTPSPSTTVYVLPPEGPLYVEQCFLPNATVRFTSYRAEPSKIWIVAVGPAAVQNVVIGNQCQLHLPPTVGGHVCRTVDPWPLGVQLSVDLVTPGTFPR